NIIDELQEKIFPSTKGVPKPHQFVACRLQGKDYYFDSEAGDWVCEKKGYDPFYLPPDKEHNPNRPLDKGDDTDYPIYGVPTDEPLP
ncbi:hypothetical protein R0K19_24855, partial [Bacillus sp. SIMBA_161]